jgi:hypothetical protein
VRPPRLEACGVRTTTSTRRNEGRNGHERVLDQDEQRPRWRRALGTERSDERPHLAGNPGARHRVLARFRRRSGVREPRVVRRHDHDRHQARQRPRQLSEQRDRDRSRQHHARSERPHDRRRRRARLHRAVCVRFRGGQHRGPPRGHCRGRLDSRLCDGLFVLGGRDNRLRRLSSSHNVLGGILVIASPGTRIKHNSISANGSPPTKRG